jgi:choline dehydrogenase-like flavoprotein
VCIVGTGAGGSAAARALSEAGRRVVMVEAGSFFTPSDFSQREEQMMPRLFYDAGGRWTKNQAIRIMHGKGVGGSTLHNINLCKPLPEELLEEWDLPGFDKSSFGPFLAQAEQLLGVSEVEAARVNRNNQILKDGVERLGYRGGPLRHNREGCVGSGFCELGCAYDAKLNAMRVMLPAAVKNGTDIFADTKAIRLLHSGRRITELLAETIPPAWSERAGHAGPLRIRAKHFVVSAGAIETPLLLQRSEIPDPHRRVGARLHLHPGLAAAGVFEDPVYSWQGIPQSYECTEFLSFRHADHRRIWILPNAAHPVGAATIMPGFGQAHAERMRQYAHLAPLSAMLHDSSSGTVRERWGKPVIDYVLTPEDREQLALGLRECAKLLFAGGAQKVWLPFERFVSLEHPRDVRGLEIQIRDHDIGLVSVHPMSSVWMGRRENDSCLDHTCRYWHMDNLHVADTSVYPTSIGIPPQVTTYAIGLYVGSMLAGMS